MTGVIDKFLHSVRLLSICVLLLSIAGGTLAATLFYTIEKSEFVSEMTEEAELLLSLTNSFVSVYASIAAQPDAEHLAVPAMYRAEAAEHFNSNIVRDERFVARMVGMPESFLETPPADQHMADFLYSLDKNEITGYFSEMTMLDDKPVIRTVFPARADSQSCVDCHNQLQDNKFNWQVNDYIGAFFIDRGVAQPLKTFFRQSVLVGFVVTMLALLCSLLVYKSWKQKLLTSKLEKMASTDPLTGCLNRRALHELTELLLSDNETMDSLLILDLDHFKQINDTYGHQAGDEVLREFTRHIRSRIRSTDILARIGGEEFVIYLANITDQQTVELACSLCNLVEKAVVDYGNQSIDYTVSIGCVCIDKTTEKSINDWIAKADQYLYQAKKLGRNRVFMPYSLVRLQEKLAA